MKPRKSRKGPLVVEPKRSAKRYGKIAECWSEAEHKKRERQMMRRRKR
jgi:hypothetical protein